jgi:hypothetical protein
MQKKIYSIMDKSENIFLRSPPIDAEEAGKVDSFSTLPIRINLRSDLADDAGSRLLMYWEKCNGRWARKNFHVHAPLGNALFFLYPEALPEQLGIITYLTDFGRLMVSLPH